MRTTLHLGTWKKQLCEKYSDRTCVIFENPKTFESKSLNFREFDIQTNKLSNLFINLGIHKGDIVSIILHNCIESVLCVFALGQIGAIFGPINPEFKNEELKFLLNNNESPVVITTSSILGNLISIQDDLIHLQKIILLDVPSSVDGLRENLQTYDYCSSLLSASSHLPEIDGINAKKDPALIVYTGGTTGFPKGALLSHYNIFRSVQMMLGISKEEEPPDYTELVKKMGIVPKHQFVNLMLMPLFHVNALIATFMLTISIGGATLIIPKFSATHHWRLVEKYHVSMFIAVPAMLAILLKTKSDKTIDTSSIVYISTGAAPLTTSLKQEFEKVFQVRVQPGGLGLTECTVSSTGFPLGTFKEGSVGKPLINTELKIVDISDYRKELEPFQTGEILLKGDHIMLRYYKNPTETEKVMLDGSWLKTGDLGYVDDEGFLFLSGRSKDMIIRGGENIYPVEIEETIAKIPEIHEVAVIPTADDIYGQLPLAFITFKPGMTLTKEKIADFCSKHLANFKIPKDFIFLSSIPKTNIGKPDKRKLAQYSI